MWTLKKRPETSRFYSGEFANLDLANGRFQLPEQLSRTFGDRNPNRSVEFYAFPINDGGLKYGSLFDPVFVESDKSGRLRKDKACIMIPDSNNLVSIGSELMQYLDLTDKVSVEGYDQIVRLWNPEEFERCSLSWGIEFNGNLEDFQRECYRYKRGL